MSYYVWNSNLSYADYLQSKSFVDDICGAIYETGQNISMEVSHQTREIIASNEALAIDNIMAMEAATAEITNSISGGFDRLSYSLKDISSGVSEINATFHWGFGQLIANIGHMNDALSELIKIAKTPVQTVAFNHFEIARDAYRQGLFQEALEELEKAIKGDHSSSGYKLEWRFHQMVGTIRLGFVECDLSLIDLAQAEESFVLAARYAKTDYPKEAGYAFLSAGWAAYCQGKFKEALTHTERATVLLPELGEAYFQVAKVRIAMGEVETALPVLRKAIDLDRFYALKAIGDGDFQKYEIKVRNFIEALRVEKYQSIANKVIPALSEAGPWLSRNLPQDKGIECAAIIKMFVNNKMMPYFDLLEKASSLFEAANSLNELNLQWKKIMEEISSTANPPVERLYVFALSFDEPLTKTKTDTNKVEVYRDDIYSGLKILTKESIGIPITNFEFCKIPAGQFVIGEMAERRQVNIPKDFFMGRYLVTQAQWMAIMQNNPSYFKGDLSLPVDSVSWDECKQFIEELNSRIGTRYYRLPTEDEWEYACRAGSTTKYHFGNDVELLRDYAWYIDNSANKTHPVGQLKPNAWGLYDMHGNLAEWTDDPYFIPGVNEPILKGGAWHMKADNLRCSIRGNVGTDSVRNNINGFRLVRIKH